MNSMIKENGVTFKELEKNIYAWVCQIGREFTKEFLERYDRMLMEDRDKKKYRNKGARQTTVKTVYGEVTYQRMVYEVIEEDGTKRFVYLLDETLELDHVGRDTGVNKCRPDLDQHGGIAGKRDHGAVLQGMCHESQRDDRTDHQCNGSMERHPGVRGKGLQ